MAFILYFLIYKQKAPVDLLFLEFHTDNDVARIISALSVTGGERTPTIRLVSMEPWQTFASTLLVNQREEIKTHHNRPVAGLH